MAIGSRWKQQLLFSNLYCSDSAFLFPLTFTSSTLEEQTTSEYEGGLDQGGLESGRASLLPPPRCCGRGRRLQLIRAGPAGATEKAGAPAPRRLGWIHRGGGNPPHPSGAQATSQRTRQHAIPSDELQPPSMPLQINSHFSHDNKKIPISASSHHLAGYQMKQACVF